MPKPAIQAESQERKCMDRYDPGQNPLQRFQERGGYLEIESKGISQPPGNGSRRNIMDKRNYGTYVRFVDNHIRSCLSGASTSDPIEA